jgi:hypothetical protein
MRDLIGRVMIGLIVVSALLVAVAVAGANTIESPVNKDVGTSVDAVSVGLETVYAYSYGESTILIAVVNPNVLFSYRNIYVVSKKYAGISDIYRKVSGSLPQ